MNREIRIKSLIDFSGIPKGTTGIAFPDGEEYEVTWDLPDRKIKDWFDKYEFNKYLVVIN